MNVFQFMSDSPILTFALAYLVYALIARLVRGLMVRKHGWPPLHLDADGDRKDDDAEEV